MAADVGGVGLDDLTAPAPTPDVQNAVDLTAAVDSAPSIDWGPLLDPPDTGLSLDVADAWSTPEDISGPITKPQPDATAVDIAYDNGGCKDQRVKNDNKVGWDSCWAPPLHYCSQEGYAASVWLGCKPGTLVCCEFPSSCIPCGWTHCSASAGLSPEQLQKCVDTAKLWDAMTATVIPDECVPYFPNYEPICWDDVDPAWNTKEHHKDDEAAWLTWQ